MTDLLNPVFEFTPSGRASGWQRIGAKRFDLHCHTTYPDATLQVLPGLVYHPLLTPAETYHAAKRRGMDFVTITDHDTIDGCNALLDEFGDLSDFVVGEEVSVSFPEDGTVVHVNV